MLPKIWKKVLLAICIIACLFNVISKLVNRTSLEVNLKSANDGNTIWGAFKNNDVNITYTTDVIEGVKNETSTNTQKNEIKSSSTNSVNNTNNTNSTNNVVSEDKENIDNDNEENNNTNTNTNTNTSKSNKVFKYTTFLFPEKE